MRIHQKTKITKFGGPLYLCFLHKALSFRLLIVVNNIRYFGVVAF